MLNLRNPVHTGRIECREGHKARRPLPDMRECARCGKRQRRRPLPERGSLTIQEHSQKLMHRGWFKWKREYDVDQHQLGPAREELNIYPPAGQRKPRVVID